MKGETAIRCMRQKYKDQWVTANTVRNSCDRGGGYTRGVLERAAELGVIEKKTELRPFSWYRIDPTEGRIACPIEPEKPYEETICSQLEGILENCSLQNDRECKKEIMSVINQSLEKALKAEDYGRVRKLADLAEATSKLSEGDKASDKRPRQRA